MITKDERDKLRAEIYMQRVRYWDAVVSTGRIRDLGPPARSIEHGDYIANFNSATMAHFVCDSMRAITSLLDALDLADFEIDSLRRRIEDFT